MKFWQNHCKFVVKEKTMAKLISSLFISIFIIGSSSINKLEFYNAFKSNDKKVIENGIQQVKEVSASNLKNAYLGALIMKSAQFPSTPKEKIAVFKEGKELLEASISKEPKNGEFRFLRLAMQEKSPKILHYNSNLEEDKKILLDTYDSLEFTVKKVIKKYAEESTVISPNDFK